MQNVINLLKDLKGKSLSREERIEKAILLATWIQNAANQNLTRKERKFQQEIARMVQDMKGKALTMELFDQSFRSKDPERAADQISYLLKGHGIAEFLQGFKKWGLLLFEQFPPKITQFLIPLIQSYIRKDARKVILPNDPLFLKNLSNNAKKEGIRLNINHLGEAILGEEEAKRRVDQYLVDLESDEIDYISVKISTLYSQINLIDYQKTLEVLADPYRKLLRKCKNGTKFVNLDMEEYKDLRLTVDLFKKVLSESEFKTISAGIVLQSYLPDSFEIQKELTHFALKRVAEGGAPIKIRLVKGANLAMEKVEAAIKGWPQAPFETKLEADIQFKKMVEYGLNPKNTQGVHIGIGSHNIFDIAYAMLLQHENGLKNEVTFEMLEGMAPSVRRILQTLTDEMVIYSPTADDDEFQYAIAYLVRRLDENTGPENYLRISFSAEPGSAAWQHQADLFASSCMAVDELYSTPRRQQNRNKPHVIEMEGFRNAPDTDWSLRQNQEWILAEKKKWEKLKIDPIPSVIGGKNYLNRLEGVGRDPSNPQEILYQYHCATQDEIKHALSLSKHDTTSANPDLFLLIAKKLEEKRGDLIGTMLMDVGKPIAESDVEISEAIDFLRYYLHSKNEFVQFPEIELNPKGTIVVASPWNFPLSIPAGGISAALIAGNRVIFKPAPEAILTGYELAKIFWEAGVSKDDLQFITCRDEEAAFMVRDPRVDALILTGGTETARKILKMRPGLDLMAETGGKNAMIVTAMADRDLAIKDTLQSAFGYAGQKCSALSVLILEKELFENKSFKDQLKDAVKSLKVGSPWDVGVKIPPLVLPISDTLKKAIRLDEGEEWLVEPHIDKNNPQMLSPGIKWNVKAGNFSQVNELFGPVLSVIKAENLEEAIQIANQTEYGLTGGLQSLDVREHEKWLKEIEVGNCYINRGITGAVVERQPFGGVKSSVFGPGAKAGGPNYLLQLMQIKEKKLPEELAAPPKEVRDLLEKLPQQFDIKKLKLRAGNYSFWWKHFFAKAHDPAFLLGQNNLQIYVPCKQVILRITEKDHLIDLISVAIACKIVGAPLMISVDPDVKHPEWIPVEYYIDRESEFIARISQVKYKRIRMLSEPGEKSTIALSELGLWIKPAPVCSLGRVELLHYLQEISVSEDYHRYGNLGAKENELRSPLVSP